MARVVMVHGAFNELWGPNELRSRWVPALNDGLWHHGSHVDIDDVAVCFYGDLFRIDPEKLDSADWEASRAGSAELLAGFAGDSGDGELATTLGQAASQAAWDRTVDMVASMMADPGIVDVAKDRLIELIDTDTAVVVAHSLGSMLAYSVLVGSPDLAVDTLVTLGSPLGTDLAAAVLPANASDGTCPWPGGVQRWVNVAAVGDHATGTGCLADRFGGRVQDRRIHNGHRAHDPEPYLNSSASGEAVAGALARTARSDPAQD